MALRILLFLSGILLVCTACQSTDQADPASEIVITPAAAALLQLQPGLQWPEPAALTSGVLVIHNRCIRLMNADHPRGYAVIWKATIAFDGISVHDRQTTMQTQLGMPVTISGGVVGDDYVAHLTNPNDNPCDPPFWFVTHIPPVRK